VSKRGLLFALLGAAMVLAPAAHATVVKRPPVMFVRGTGSYTEASRKTRDITTIVIHVTDGGSFAGNVWWLSGGHSHVSAHYVVARDGQIAQLVHLSDIAWHAGNWKVNVHSIGIEHVGETYDPAGFTLDQYRQSAKLVAWLARRSNIPVDREHIIGHAEVPDPATGAPAGGSDHHTDPGPYWNWKLYMRLVRHYAFPVQLHVRSTSLFQGQTVAGIVPWRVATKGARAGRVDFIVDGEVIWRDHRPPFSFGGGHGLNTTQLKNGNHVLVARAVGPDHAVGTTRVVVGVRNHVFAVTTSRLEPWQKVHGALVVRANVLGARTTGLGLYVDGKVVSRDRRPPYRLIWNTHRVGDGRHTLTVAAEAIDGRVARRRLVVVVKNRVPAVVHPKPRPKPKPRPTPAPKPKPKPKPAPKPQPAPVAVLSQTLADGQTVEGTVTWQAQTTGPVVRVEFVVDGTVRGAATVEPWGFAWDTSAESPGAHVVAVRAMSADARTSEASATVTVASPAPAAPSG
jgi:N-acetyl-anhydromuramyl-L-alanine amidase AmpD